MPARLFTGELKFLQSAESCWNIDGCRNPFHGCA
jgi:hypothetical protein